MQLCPFEIRFRPHHVETAYERGWAEFTNGDLLSAAESAGFDLLITTDKRIQYQQNLSGRKLSLLVIDTNDWSRIRRFTTLVTSAVSSIRPGDYVQVEIPFY
jgi:hypothetical protein